MTSAVEPNATGFAVIAPLPGVALVSGTVQQAAAQAPRSATALVLPAQWPPLRRQQCLAVRALAAVALASQQMHAPVGRDADGLPMWPAGMVGSLAHETHFALAASAHRHHWQALGVDIEADAALPDEAGSVVLCAVERERLAALAPTEAARAARWIFSAKECVHKALNPLNGAWLEFDEVAIQWSAGLPVEALSWQLQPLSAAARKASEGLTLEGRWWTQQGCIHALLGVRS
ncbi:MAG: 4'-phosphopantetheinyl transferase superfamily protein [Pseudomonadota bacterium]